MRKFTFTANGCHEVEADFFRIEHGVLVFYVIRHDTEIAFKAFSDWGRVEEGGDAAAWRRGVNRNLAEAMATAPDGSGW